MRLAVVRALGCAVVVVVSACASQSTDSVDKYSHDLDACRSQMASGHPEMSNHDREKSCKQQVGPAPMTIPAKAPVAL